MKRLSLPKFSELNRRERLLAFGSLLVICAVVVDRVILEPWGRHTRHVHQEIERLERSLRGQYDVLSREPQMRAEASAYRDDVRSEEAPVPDMAAILREIEGLGTQSGITLGEVKPLEGERQEAYQGYVIDVRYHGSLEQWIYFIYLLNHSPSLFEIERATVTRAEQDPSSVEGILRVSGTLIHSPGLGAPVG